MGKEYKYIGKPMPRRDGVDIVTGAAQFLDDLANLIEDPWGLLS